MSLNLLKSRLSGQDRVGFIGNLNPSTIHTLQPRDGGNWRIRFSDKLSCIWVPPCGRRWMRLVINVKLLRDQGRFLLFRRRTLLSLSFSFLSILFIRSTSFHFSPFNIVFMWRNFSSATISHWTLSYTNWVSLTSRGSSVPLCLMARLQLYNVTAVQCVTFGST